MLGGVATITIINFLFHQPYFHWFDTQVLREVNFAPDILKRRPEQGESKPAQPEDVQLWTNHRTMEWLRSCNLSEYAPNLRGSGVHGGLIILGRIHFLGSGPKGPMSCRTQGWISIRPSTVHWITWKIDKIQTSHWIALEFDEKWKKCEIPIEWYGKLMRNWKKYKTPIEYHGKLLQRL